MRCLCRGAAIGRLATRTYLGTSTLRRTLSPVGLIIIWNPEYRNLTPLDFGRLHNYVVLLQEFDPPGFWTTSTTRGVLPHPRASWDAGTCHYYTHEVTRRHTAGQKGLY